jgi:ribosomal protein L13
MGRNILGKLKVYRGDQHPHSAQQPKPMKFQMSGAGARMK